MTFNIAYFKSSTTDIRPIEHHLLLSILIVTLYARYIAFVILVSSFPNDQWSNVMRNGACWILLLLFDISIVHID